MMMITEHVELTTTTDAELLTSSQLDPGCFTSVYARHVEAIFGFVALRVGPSAAEDITADVFATAFDKRAQFRATATTARPWLYGIAARQLLKHRDAEQRWLRGATHMSVDVATFDELLSADDRIDAQSVGSALVAAIALLPQGERDVMLLHVISGLTHEEVARALGIRRGSAKTRLSRATVRLRALLPQDLTSSDEGAARHAD